MPSFKIDTNAPRFVDSGQTAVQKQAVADPGLFNQAFAAIAPVAQTLYGKYKQSQTLQDLNALEQDLAAFKDAPFTPDAKPEVVSKGIERYKAMYAEGQLGDISEEQFNANLRALQRVELRTQAAYGQQIELERQGRTREAKLRTSQELRRIIADDPDSAALVVQMSGFGVLGDARAGDLEFSGDLAGQGQNLQVAEQIKALAGFDPSFPVEEAMLTDQFAEAQLVMQDSARLQAQNAALEASNKFDAARQQEQWRKQKANASQFLNVTALGLLQQAASGNITPEDAIFAMRSVVNEGVAALEGTYSQVKLEEFNTLRKEGNQLVDDLEKGMKQQLSAERLANMVQLRMDSALVEILDKSPDAARNMVLLDKVFKDMPEHLAKQFEAMLTSRDLMRSIFGTSAATADPGMQVPDLGKSFASATADQKAQMAAGLASFTRLYQQGAFDGLDEDEIGLIRDVARTIDNAYQDPNFDTPAEINQYMLDIASHSQERYNRIFKGNDDNVRSADLFRRLAQASAKQAASELASLRSTTALRAGAGGGLLGGVELSTGTSSDRDLASRFTYKMDADGNITIASVDRTDLTGRELSSLDRVKARMTPALQNLSRAVRAEAHTLGLDTPNYQETVNGMFSLFPEFSAVPNLVEDVLTGSELSPAEKEVLEDNLAIPIEDAVAPSGEGSEAARPLGPQPVEFEEGRWYQVDDEFLVAKDGKLVPFADSLVVEEEEEEEEVGEFEATSIGPVEGGEVAATDADPVFDVTKMSTDEQRRNFDTYASDMVSSARKYGVPPGLLINLLFAESSFLDKNISGANKSHVGATGIAQFMPDTAKDLKVDPTDPVASIDAAAKYLSQMHREFKDWKLTVAAYNAGWGNARKRRLDRSKYNEETQNYLIKVFGEDAWPA